MHFVKSGVQHFVTVCAAHHAGVWPLTTPQSSAKDVGAKDVAAKTLT